MSRLRTLLTAALLTAASVAAQAADEPLKVGFVYVGPVSDHGWSYQHDLGRQALEAALGDKVETTYVENVPEGADAERVLNELAARGNKLIFTTSFGFMNATVKAASRWPDVKFEHATGYKRTDNLTTYAARFYEGRYVVGKIAGRMTKSNVVGYIGSYPIPEVIRGINSAFLAARSVNPDVQFKIVWVNSWYDPGKEREAAKVLVDQGADVLLQHTDSPAPVQFAEQAGVWAVGQSSDMSAFGPKAHLTAITDVWGDYYTARAQAVLDGSWQSMDTWGGLASGMVVITDYNDAIPEDVVAEAEAARKAIIAGELHPFTGPIRNQAGDVVVPEGERASDEQLLSMDYYVEGIEGAVPK